VNGIRKYWQVITQADRVRIDPASLQFRLTLEVTVFSILGLCSVAAWSSWKMQQILIATHKQNIEQFAARFPRDVELYSEMLPLAAGIQKTIQNLSSPGLLIWVYGSNKQLLAQSSGINISSQVVSELMANAQQPISVKIFLVQGRHYALCSSPVMLKGEPMAMVYLAKDVTDEQHQLNSAIQGLLLVCFVTTGLLLLIITLRIRRSLKPLQEINQLADAISADALGKTQLQLQHSPSEVKALAQTLNMMLSRLSESWEQQRQFVSNASHELRTPLTVVLGYLHSLLRRSTNLNEYQREALSTAAAEAERTVGLLQDLLDLARADSGYLPVRLEPMVLDDLAYEVTSMAERFSERTILVQSPGNISVMADRDRLKQVLINLVDNAVKYSESTATVELKLTQQPHQTLIQVCDHGIGIPLPDQSRIFERFYRVDSARSRLTGGHGLGLAIVKTLVESMGGRISVRSKPGEGSIFTITLPTPK
jgi:heavy metal sensor kinase